VNTACPFCTFRDTFLSQGPSPCSEIFHLSLSFDEGRSVRSMLGNSSRKNRLLVFTESETIYCRIHLSRRPVLGLALMKLFVSPRFQAQQFPANPDEDNPLYSTDGFRMYCLKVLPCSKRFSHDWLTCPFTHPAEKAKRRDPRVVAYTGIACPDMKRAVACPRGEACTFAHNVFEYWLHPSR